MLDSTAIIAEAEEIVGVSDPDSNVALNLQRLVDALNSESGMATWAFDVTRAGLLSRTIDRLEGVKWMQLFPEIADQPIDSPVFLMGLPRSGTTYFQYLFDRDSRFRLIRSWEALYPSPPPGFDPESAAQRKAGWNARRLREHPPVEGFDALHLIDQDGSEECHAFLEQSFGGVGLNNMFRVPSYFDYALDEMDFEATYRIHKRQLQLLQWRSGHKPWALKYPNHLLAIPEILRVYPDAKFVMTHRDPVQTLASISKLSSKLRATRCDAPVDLHDIGRDMLHFVGRHIDRIMDLADQPHADRVVHVDYYALVGDPASAMLDVHTALGLDTPDEVRRAVTDWRRENPKNARGKNEYTLEQFGLDADLVAEQFGDYMRRFDIPREKDGLARIGVTS